MTHGAWVPLVSEVAQLTGESALRFFREPIAVETKRDGSPVTIADRTAEATAREWIQRRFPDDAIVGEELGADPPSARRRWLIDPIDGTKSFVRGVPLWGSMIAVEEDGRVVAGAICCAAAGQLVAAADGEGCFCNGVRAGVSAVESLAEATILTTDATFPANPDRVERWAALSARVAVSRTWGDCYGYVMVATGRAEAMVDDRLNVWDVSSLIPIVREAGGVLTDWRGIPWAAGEDGIATNAALALPVREALGIPGLSPR